MGELQQLETPDLPVEDEYGQECVEYRCWKCKRPSYMAREAAEMIRSHGSRLGCLPCDRPDLFRWEYDEETQREILGDLTPAHKRQLLKRLPGGEEREEYNDALAMLQLMRDRRDDLTNRAAEINEELRSLRERLPAQEELVARLNKEMQVATSNAVEQKRDEIRELQEKIERLRGQIESSE